MSDQVSKWLADWVQELASSASVSSEQECLVWALLKRLERKEEAGGLEFHDIRNFVLLMDVAGISFADISIPRQRIQLSAKYINMRRRRVDLLERTGKTEAAQIVRDEISRIEGQIVAGTFGEAELRKLLDLPPAPMTTTAA